MGQMLIRNLDDGVIAKFKERAARHRTSVEEEARQVLTASAGVDRDAVIARLNAIAERIGPQTGPDSLEILRAYRYPEGDD